jgi:hypothetical protein
MAELGEQTMGWTRLCRVVRGRVAALASSGAAALVACLAGALLVG